MFDSNRRQYPRANYPCQLTLCGTDGSSDTILANISNIGAGGLCVYLDQEILSGVKVDIRINFSSHSTPFKCRGIVVRSHAEKDKRFYATGIQFEPLSDLKRAFLSAIISELIALEKKGQN